MAAHNELGKWGEDCAADYLQRKGYTIVERDWKSGHRDIDIIAVDENRTVVFVEVKTRRNRVFGEPEESVDYRKMRNLQAAINHYVKYRRIDNEIRFDIITVVGTIGSEPEIDHLIDVPL
ncbi:YraN family protein [uncultured Prevotella sp.]|jgi:putative endonuclease|uniref:YraN family protein n=1 Tax=uncultured Prevotella sp. TaxID=159272 RepID=UPI0025D39678|nr:YraN family protein [uncultured Prevotella sp.]